MENNENEINYYLNKFFNDTSLKDLYEAKQKHAPAISSGDTGVYDVRNTSHKELIKSMKMSKSSIRKDLKYDKK